MFIIRARNFLLVKTFAMHFQILLISYFPNPRAKRHLFIIYRGDVPSSISLGSGLRFHRPFAGEAFDTLQASAYTLSPVLFVSRVLASSARRESFRNTICYLREDALPTATRRGARRQSFRGRLGWNKDGSGAAD